METINKLIDQLTFESLVQWLSNEYEEADARVQLEKAKLNWKDSETLEITYENAAIDLVKVTKIVAYKIVHLNPPKENKSKNPNNNGY